MKKKLLSLALALVMCLSLTVPAFAAAEQKITVGDETYTAVLQAIMSEEEDKPVALKLETDVQVTATIVLGSSDYGGLFNGQTMTVASHDVTIDLNGHTLTGGKDMAVFEVQAGYKLTVIDSSADKAGKLVTQGEKDVVVAEGATYVPLTTESAKPEEKPTEAPEEKPEETPEEKPAAPAFSDVAATSPFAAAIDWAVEQKIAAGYNDGTFRPGNTCMVSHILIFLWRANGSEGAGESSTEELAATKWAVKANLGLQDSNLLREPCTRALAVTFLWKAAGSPEMKTEKTFTDVAADAEYAQAVAWAVESGVTAGTGDGTTFSPDATCTRGQIATFLYRASQK